MSKKIPAESVSPQEFLQGLKELEKDGVELPCSPESILNQVINNTAKTYIGKKNNIHIQPVNANEAKKEANAKVLRKNMEAANRFGPKGTDAHHIVPVEDTRPWAKQHAEAARAILRRWAIPLNHEANGVYLPSSSKISVESLPNAYPHKQTHTKVYYLNIAGQLADANERKECIDMLREIGEDLEDGVYPIKKGQR